jgi:hypothetical protein
VTSRRHRRLPSIWRDGSSLAEGETVIVMNERVVEGPCVPTLTKA